MPAGQNLTPAKDIPVEAEFELTFTAAGNDHAQTVCHTVGYEGYGAYGFTYSIDLDRPTESTRDYLSAGTATPLWLPVETTMVRRVPVIYTAATRWSATTDGQEHIFFTDEIWQIDWPDAATDTDHGQWGGLDHWEGDAPTIRTELWRIEGETTSESCTADNPAAKLIAVNETTPALNTWGASQKVSGSKFKAEGGDATYTFVITWPGDARTEPYQSVCGEKSETITLIHEAPEFVTELLAPADLKGTSAQTAAERKAAVEVQPGTELIDVLYVAFPDGDQLRTNMAGWKATWDMYFLPVAPDDEPLEIGEDESGQKVYEGAVCTPETFLASSGDPVPVEQEGNYFSPKITVPDASGMVFAVETVTNAEDQVARRGTCGVVAESAIVLPPPEQPKPKITTNAPTDAQVGDKIKDEATLTGPYLKGTQVEFWYQHTPFTNPDVPRDQLTCAVPDPADMKGAVKIGVTTLDQDIAEGVTEKLYSPEFTSTETGCTWIKEIAYGPGDGPNRDVIAEGHFGAANERTMWHPPLRFETGGSLPTTGANVGIWAALGGIALLAGGVLLGFAYWRRNRTS